MQPAFSTVGADMIPARTGMAIARAGERIASCGEYLALGMQQMVIVVAAGMLTCVAGVLGESVRNASRVCMVGRQCEQTSSSEPTAIPGTLACFLRC